MGQRMRGWIWVVGLVVMSLPAIARAAAKDDANAIVITFKDGHQQAFAVDEISRIEFRTPGATARSDSAELPGRHHYVGKWLVGDGTGTKITFTLEDNGQASNDVDGGGHGHWTYVNGEARIEWDNGWHDIIRKIGMKHQKSAYAPGAAWDSQPANVSDAKKANQEPI